MHIQIWRFFGLIPEQVLTKAVQLFFLNLYSYRKTWTGIIFPPGRPEQVLTKPEQVSILNMDRYYPNLNRYQPQNLNMY